MARRLRFALAARLGLIPKRLPGSYCVWDN